MSEMNTVRTYDVENIQFSCDWASCNSSKSNTI